MKATETKIAATQPARKAQESGRPFFNKDGQGGFFSEGGGEREHFFKPPAIQTKLTIGQPGDKYEQEADSMAEKVVQRLTTDGGRQTVDGGRSAANGATVQAKCADCEKEDKLKKKEGEEELAPTELGVQKKEIFESKQDAPEQGVQMKAINGAPAIQAKCAACEQADKLQKKEGEEEMQEGGLDLQKMTAGGSGEKDTEQEKPDNAPSVQAKCAERESKSNENKTDFGKASMNYHIIGEPLKLSHQSNNGVGSGSIINRKPELPQIEEDIVKETGEGKTSEKGEEKNGAQPPNDDAKTAEQQPKNKKEIGNALVDIPSPIKEEETPVSMKADIGANATGTANFESQLSNHNKSGRPLEKSTRQEMEGQFGKDFSNVKVHTDDSSAKLNKQIGAKAFTNKNNIYFNEGQYSPGTDQGKLLLAHELTHTIQQGASGNIIQRMPDAKQPVANPQPPEIPDDGTPVVNNIEKKKNDDDRDKDSPPERSEMRKEGKSLNDAGETKPPIDRGEVAGEKAQEQKTEIEKLVTEEVAQKEEKGKGAAEPGKANENAGAGDAKRAEKNKAKALALQKPQTPEPFKHQEIKTPVDSEGEELPKDTVVDDSVIGLGHIGETYRNIGYEMQVAAFQKEQASYALDAVLDKTREDVSYAEEGVVVLEGNQEQRTQMNEDAKVGHTESVTRQQFVTEKAAEVEMESGEKMVDSEKLSSDAAEKAGESRNNPPDDDEAREDAEQQNADMDSTAEGAASVDNAIKGANASAIKLGEEAGKAMENNLQTQAGIQETDGLLSDTAVRIGEIRAKNEMTRAQIGNSESGPKRIRKFAEQNYKAGSDLIQVSIKMEKDLDNLQKEYFDGSKQVPGKKALKAMAEQEAEKQRKSDSLIAELLLISQMSKEDQQKYAEGLDEKRKAELLEKLQFIIDAEEQSKKESKGETQGKDEEADQRGPYYEVVKAIRSGRLKEVTLLANENFQVLTAEHKKMISEKSLSESIKDDISNITSWKNVKQMLNPWNMAVGIVKGPWDAIKGIGSGLKNFPEKWEKDPIGAVLQAAADITTGLAKLFSSVMAIVGVIAGILTIVSIFFPPAFVPVPFLGTVIAFCGKGAIITGLLAVYLNRLTYLKNLNDVGTSETAEDLLGNTQEMKKNTYDGLSGALAVVEGYGGMKMGGALKSGSWAKEVLVHQTLKPRLMAAGALAKASLISAVMAPVQLARQIGRLFGKGKQGLKAFWQYLKTLFGKKRTNKPDADLDIETGAKPPKEKQHLLDDTRSKDTKDLSKQEMLNEFAHGEGGKPRKLVEGDEGFPEFDVEVKRNGHTYRKRKGSLCWKRFSNGTPDLCDLTPFPSDKEMHEFLKREGLVTESFEDFMRSKPKNLVDPIEPGEGKVVFVEENSGKSQIASAYEDSAPGVKIDPLTGKRVVPALEFTNPNPKGRNVVRFDGIEGNRLIDRKWNVTTQSDQIHDLQRMSEALAQNPQYRGVIQVPDEKAYKAAVRALQKAGVDNIEIEIVPL